MIICQLLTTVNSNSVTENQKDKEWYHENPDFVHKYPSNCCFLVAIFVPKIRPIAPTTAQISEHTGLCWMNIPTESDKKEDKFDAEVTSAWRFNPYTKFTHWSFKKSIADWAFK